MFSELGRLFESVASPELEIQNLDERLRKAEECLRAAPPGEAVRNALKALSEARATLHPNVLPMPAPETRIRSGGAESTKPGHGSRVLVVDDEEPVVEVVTEILQEFGFSVIATTKPENAMALVKSALPHCIVSDYRMPKVSGLELAQAIQSFDPDLPILFVSGAISRDFLLNAIRLGAQAVLEKPFKADELRQICLNCAKRYRLLKLLNRSLNLLLYQFETLDPILMAQGKGDLCTAIRNEIKALTAQREALNSLAKAA